MKLSSTSIVMLISAMVITASPLYAADQARDQTRTQDQIRDQDIYGYQMMTAQERNEHRAKMRAAKTAEERERIRNEHHERMVVRAKERGVKIPDEPPANRGPGSGPGPGPGSGMGPGGGGGMGPGGGGGMGPGGGGGKR